MQIFVKSISGETITLVEAPETVDDVKARVEASEGLPVEQQRLIHGGRELESGRTLAHYGIQADDTLHLMLGLQGGYWYNRGLYNLAIMHTMNKMICRKCHCQLPLRATRCRHARCGSTDVRPKKLIYKWERIPKNLKEWQDYKSCGEFQTWRH